jgi:hypothetical protein
MRLKTLGPNCHEVSDDRTSILFSYATPVAIHVAGVGYFRTSTRHSVTTSRHINAYLSGFKAREIAQESLDALTLGLTVPAGESVTLGD